MWFVFNVKCFKMVTCILCPQQKWYSLATSRVEGEENMGEIGLLEGKMKNEKKIMSCYLMSSLEISIGCILAFLKDTYANHGIIEFQD